MYWNIQTHFKHRFPGGMLREPRLDSLHTVELLREKDAAVFNTPIKLSLESKLLPLVGGLDILLTKQWLLFVVWRYQVQQQTCT